MTVRSIDMQVLIPRTTEVSRVQQITEQQTSLQQQQFALQLQIMVEHRRQYAQPLAKTDKPLIQREAPKHEHQSSSREQHQRSPRQGETGAGSYDDPVRGHLIDIRT